MSVRSVLRLREARRVRPRVLTYPRDPNPYQHLLHESLDAEGVRAEFLPERSSSAAINLLLIPVELLRARLGGARVLHLHWVFKFVPAWAARVPGGRQAGYLWFRCALSVARLLGYRLVWTAHNLLPHSQVFPDDEAARRALVAHADVVIAHGPEVGRQLVSRFGLDPARITVIPHGPFSPAPGAPSRADARADLGLSMTDTVFGLVGRIDAYKGADDLLEAAARLDDAGYLPQDVHIVVAGSCHDEVLASRLRELAEGHDRLVLRLGWLSEEDYAGITGALDLAVLPFRRVTTSGSAIAALSCGVPVAVPAALLPDLPEESTVRFDDLTALLTDEDLRLRLPFLSQAASTHANGWSWADVATATVAAYRRTSTT